MERKKPLKAKTGLKAKSLLKSQKRLTTTKSLKPRSKKMVEIYKERVVFVKGFLDKYPLCQAYWDEKCTKISVDVHEILPRSAGGKIVNESEDNFMAVCRHCHTMITDNPKEAHKRGLRKWSWEE